MCRNGSVARATLDVIISKKQRGRGIGNRVEYLFKDKDSQPG